MTLEFDHPNPFTNDIIVVNGFWGGGKSVVTSIIGSMSGVEKKKVEHVYEYVCIAHAAGKMSADAAKAFLKIYADLSQYNNLIGREINLRWDDDSGFRNNPGSLVYLKRLFKKSGDGIPIEINSKNLALLVATHELISVSDLLFDTYGSRLKLIEVARHPIHLFNNVLAYTASFERSREFTLSYKLKGVKIPWFAKEWAEEFAEASVTDRALLSISRVQKLMTDAIDEHALLRENFLVLAFEDTVLDPQTALTQLEQFLGRKRTKLTGRVLRRQALPRTQISAGKSTSSFSFNSESSKSESQIYEQIVKTVIDTGSRSAIEEFRDAIAVYDSRWPTPLAELGTSWSK